MTRPRAFLRAPKSSRVAQVKKACGRWRQSAAVDTGLSGGAAHGGTNCFAGRKKSPKSEIRPAALARQRGERPKEGRNPKSEFIVPGTRVLKDFIRVRVEPIGQARQGEGEETLDVFAIEGSVERAGCAGIIGGGTGNNLRV